MLKVKLRDDEAYALVACLNQFRQRVCLREFESAKNLQDVEAYMALSRLYLVAGVVVEQLGEQGVDTECVHVAV